MIKPLHTICHGFDLSHNAISHSCSCLPDVRSASPQRFLGPGGPRCCFLWGLATSIMLTKRVALHSLILGIPRQIVPVITPVGMIIWKPIGSKPGVNVGLYSLLNSQNTLPIQSPVKEGLGRRCKKCTSKNVS